MKGKFKGRNIVCPVNVRPVSLMVKKACFDILREEIQGKKVLDLFAGAGSLGIEALSCAAEEVIFVDKENACVEAVKKNLFSLKNTAAARVYLKDAFRAVKDLSLAKETFDFVFLDPPYYKEMLRKTLQTLEEYDILAPSGYIICLCYIKDEFVKESNKFSLILDKKYGQTRLLIYRKSIL